MTGSIRLSIFPFGQLSPKKTILKWGCHFHCLWGHMSIVVFCYLHGADMFEHRDGRA